MRLKPFYLLLAGLLVTGCATSPDHGPFEGYWNQAYGIRFAYPAVYELVERESPEMLSVRVERHGKRIFSVSNYSDEMQAMVRQYTVPGSEQAVSVGGRPGLAYRVQDQSNGEGQYNAGGIPHIMILDGGRFWLFTGQGEEFDRILATVEFTAP